MFSRVVLCVQQSRGLLVQQVRRNFAATAAVYQKADPIQELFLTKIREYASKSKGAGGKLVDATPEIEKEYANEMERIDKQYRAHLDDLSKFPTFNFTDASLQPIGVNVDYKEDTSMAAEEAAEEEDPEKPYWEA